MITAFYWSTSAWETYYSKIPKKKKAKAEPVYLTEARADPMAFRNRKPSKASMEVIRSAPSIKKIKARRKGFIIKK